MSCVFSVVYFAHKFRVKALKIVVFPLLIPLHTAM